MTEMTLVEELKWRGFVNQTTYPDLFELDKEKVTFYNGYDASADSLTIGNLATVMMNKTFLRHGYKGVIVAGGATSLIGDPGGKDSERPLQSEEVVKVNVEAIRKQLASLLGNDTQLVNNLDWFKDMNVLEFLRDVGKYFSITPLIQRDYIANRLGEGGSGISFTELSYTLLQGYDYLQLYERYNVTLQLAGSDQWGNSISGVELIKKVKNKTVHVLTTPLIVNQATGKKFGKSEEGAIWLDANKTSPLEFYQFWINLDDKGVGDYLKVFTELDKSEIDAIIEEQAKNPSERHAQKKLAEEVTKLVHGPEITERVKQATNVLIGVTDVVEVNESVIIEISNQIKHIKVKNDANILDVLVESGLASSKGEARRLFDANGIYINSENAKGETLANEDFHNNRLILRRGKAFKDSALIEIEHNS